MRINELLIESEQLDEISLAGIGKGIGAAAGAIGRGVGNIKGAWQGAVDAYTQNRDRVAPIAQRNVARGGQAKPEQAAAPGTVQTPQSYGGAGEIAAPNLLARAQQGTTQDPALQGQQPPAQSNTANAQPAVSTPTAQPAAAPAADASNAQADQQAKIGVAQINKIIPSLRARDLQSVKKNVDATIAKKSKQPAAQGQASPAQGSNFSQGGYGQTTMNVPSGVPSVPKTPGAAPQQAQSGTAATPQPQTATSPTPQVQFDPTKPQPKDNAEARAMGFKNVEHWRELNRAHKEQTAKYDPTKPEPKDNAEARAMGFNNLDHFNRAKQAGTQAQAPVAANESLVFFSKYLGREL